MSLMITVSTAESNQPYRVRTDAAVVCLSLDEAELLYAVLGATFQKMHALAYERIRQGQEPIREPPDARG